jgi:hypothetical protein
VGLTLLPCDNLSDIKIAKNLKLHFILSQQKKKKIAVTYVGVEDQTAIKI